MKVWHGTDKAFSAFEAKFVGTGEGVAARGKGINFALDREVALFYMNRCPGNTGYLYYASVPDKEHLIDLDGVGGGPEVLPKLPAIASEVYWEFFGIDVDDIFEEALLHEDTSPYADVTRMRNLFDLLLLNTGNVHALTELKDWAPGYDWAATIGRLNPGCLGLDIEFDDGMSLYKSLTSTCGGEADAQRILSNYYIRGTYGNEPLAEARNAEKISVVIFDAKEITILNRFEIDRNLNLDSQLSSFEM